MSIVTLHTATSSLKHKHHCHHALLVRPSIALSIPPLVPLPSLTVFVPISTRVTPSLFLSRSLHPLPHPPQVHGLHHRHVNIRGLRLSSRCDPVLWPGCTRSEPLVRPDCFLSGALALASRSSMLHFPPIALLAHSSTATTADTATTLLPSSLKSTTMPDRSSSAHSSHT